MLVVEVDDTVMDVLVSEVVEVELDVDETVVEVVMV